MKNIEAKYKPRALAFLALPLMLISGCFGQTKGDTNYSTVDFWGSVDKGRYSNSFFGFRLTAPEDFTFIEPESAKIHAKAGMDLIKTGNQSMAKRIDDAVAKQSVLFGFMEKPSGTAGNSILEVVVLKQAQGVTANMALLASANLLTANPNFKIVKSLDNIKYGNKTFAGAVVKSEINTIKMTHELYVIMLRGYSVHFSVTYTTDDGRTKMLDVLRSLEFTK